VEESVLLETDVDEHGLEAVLDVAHLPLKMPPTMLRSLSRSTEYSSSLPSSRRATRFSSFSQLTMSSMRGPFFFMPRNFLTVSMMLMVILG